MRDRRDMQSGIGRTPGRRDDRAGVFETFPRDQIARQWAAVFEDLHHQMPGPRCNRGALLIDRRDHGGPERCKAEYFRDHAHGVGGELPGTSAQCGHRNPLELVELLCRHVAGHYGARGFICSQDRYCLAAESAGQSGATEHKHRRYVAADHRHHDAGKVLVATAEAYQAVIGMRANDQFDRIRRSPRGTPGSISCPGDSC